MTPPAFVISGILLTLGLFRFRILDIVPIARDAVIENINDGVIVLDTQKRILDINCAAQMITACPVSSLIGIHIDKLDNVLPGLKNHLVNGTRQPLKLNANNGILHYYKLQSIPLYNRNQNSIGCVITLHDVTERKKAEDEIIESKEKLHRIIQSVFDGLIVTNTHGEITEVNKRIVDISGLSETELVGKSFVRCQQSFERIRDYFQRYHRTK
jgi:PAS domain S-box-containing protein